MMTTIIKPARIFWGINLFLTFIFLILFSVKAGRLLPYTHFLLVKAKSTLDRFSSKTLVNQQSTPLPTPKPEPRRRANTVTFPERDTSADISGNSTPDRNTSPLLFDDNISIDTVKPDIVKGDNFDVSMATNAPAVSRSNKDNMSLVTESHSVVRNVNPAVSIAINTCDVTSDNINKVNMETEPHLVARADTTTPDSLDSSLLLFDDNDSVNSSDLDVRQEPAKLDKCEGSVNHDDTHRDATEFTHLKPSVNVIKDKTIENDNVSSKAMEMNSKQQSEFGNFPRVDLDSESSHVLPLNQQDSHRSEERTHKDLGRGGDQTNLVSEFYAHSRLHHISTWGAEFKAYVNQLQAKGDFQYFSFKFCNCFIYFRYHQIGKELYQHFFYKIVVTKLHPCMAGLSSVLL